MYPKLVKEYLDIANNGNHQEDTAEKRPLKIKQGLKGRMIS